MSEATGLPSWIYKRDGRLVPFEGDKISQSLFAAGEAAGQADAFLARELTEGVLHFLEAELTGNIPTTAQLAELTIKVVRELGQPGLSQAYADWSRRRLATTPASQAAAPMSGRKDAFSIDIGQSPAAVLQACAREYSLQAIFSRDLAAAHRERLLVLGGLESPLELAGCVFDLRGQDWGPSAVEVPPHSQSRRSGVLVQALVETRRRVGGFLAVDGPEYSLTPFASAGDLAKNAGELTAGLEATGLNMVINLNCPAGGDGGMPDGPLFGDLRRPSPPAHIEEYRMVLLEKLLRPSLASRIRMDWHLSGQDFEGNGSRLLRLARWAVDSPALCFSFDRAGRFVSLAEGIDREHPAVLLTVGLNLPRLLALPRINSAEAFLVKLASLAKMAVSAAAQKRNYLRRRAAGQELSRGFLLDRARLLVTPIGLEEAARLLAARVAPGENRPVALAQQMLSSLCANLRQAAHAASLEATVDGCPPLPAGSWSVDADADSAEPPHLATIAGLTFWTPKADLQAQVQASGPLHAVTDSGTAVVGISQDQVPGPEKVAQLLQYAWNETPVSRLRFLRLPLRQQQLSW